MEIRNKTDLTLDLQIKFSKKLFWHSNKKMLIIMESILVVIIALVLAVYINKWWIAVVAGIFAILVPLLLSLLLNNSTKKALEDAQKEEQSMEAKMDYCFHEDKMEIKLYVNSFSSSMVYPYDQFVQIVETNEVFAFILDTNQAFYVNKEGFYDGTSEDLSKIVKDQVTYQRIK